MPDFLDAVASLTDIRDKEHLEVRLVALLFDVLRASTISLWRWIERDGAIRLSEDLNMGAPGLRGAMSIGDVDAEIARPDVVAVCRFAVETSTCSRISLDLHSHLFPLAVETDVGVVLEILRDHPLDSIEERSVLALLRIYRNLVGNLDHGERDELTNLLNRRSFDRSFKAILAPDAVLETKVLLADRRRARDDGKPAHLAVVDIDFFKRVNDQFGHLYGDEVLVLLARLMRHCFREGDRLFRFGGEEFVVILRGTTPDAAITALERFRASVERFVFPQVGTITVSVGFTAILPGDSGSNAFGRADEALYVAKLRGRNQIRSHEHLISEGVLTPRVVTDDNVELF